MRFAFFVVSVVGLVFCHSAQSETRSDVTNRADIIYAQVDGTDLKLDLHIPNAAHVPPLLVWIHGGGWRAGSRKSPKLLEMTTSGFAVASISYRFTDKAIFPAQIYDCKAAIRWLRANANQHGYNADAIAVAGSSAGGQLALMLGVSGDVAELEGSLGEHLDQSSRVQAVVDYYGPSDFILRGRTQPERAYTAKSGSFALLGGIRDGKVSDELQRHASPAQYVSADDPPLLIFHGDADKTVLLDQSERIATLYEDAGLDGKLIVLKNAGHGGRDFFRGQHFQAAKLFIEKHCPVPKRGEGTPTRPGPAE